MSAIFKAVKNVLQLKSRWLVCGQSGRFFFKFNARTREKLISKAAKDNSLTFIVNHLFGKVCKTEAFFLLKDQSDTITPDVMFGGYIFFGVIFTKKCC